VDDFSYVPEVIFKSNVQIYFTQESEKLVNGLLNPAKNDRCLTKLIQDSLNYVFNNLTDFQNFTSFSGDNKILTEQLKLEETVRNANTVLDKLRLMQEEAKNAINTKDESLIYGVLYELTNMNTESEEVTQTGEKADDIEEKIKALISGEIEKQIKLIKSSLQSDMQALKESIAVTSHEVASEIQQTSLSESKIEDVEELGYSPENYEVSKELNESPKKTSVIETLIKQNDIIEVDDDFGLGTEGVKESITESNFDGLTDIINSMGI